MTKGESAVVTTLAVAGLLALAGLGLGLVTRERPLLWAGGAALVVASWCVLWLVIKGAVAAGIREARGDVAEEPARQQPGTGWVAGPRPR